MSKEESKNDVVKWRISTSFGSAPERAVYAGDRYLFQVADADWSTLNQIVSDHNEVKELRRRNNLTQEESITHMQSQLRVMKEAIEFLISAAEFSLSTPGMIRGRDQLKNAKEQGRSAITPKGSKQ